MNEKREALKMNRVALAVGVDPDALADAIRRLAAGRLEVTGVGISQKQRQRLRDRLAADPENAAHGTRTGARVCKCDSCRPVRAARNMAQRRHAAGELVDNARRRGYQWTGPELEVVARKDLSAREVARLLGRTLYAVENQRRRLRNEEPRQVYLAGVSRHGS